MTNEARNEEIDKNSENEVFTMDLQSVLLSPRSNVSSLYLITKFIVFILYDIRRKEGFCYLWNEPEGGLTSSEFSSTISHA